MFSLFNPRNRTKLGHYYFFHVFGLSRLRFSRFLFEVFLKNSNDFCHSYAGFILAAPHGMLSRHQNAIFEKKIQIKAWKTKNVKKKCQNLEQTLLKDNHKFNYKLQFIFAITNYDIAWMTIQIWFLARKSVLKKMH